MPYTVLGHGPDYRTKTEIKELARLTQAPGLPFFLTVFVSVLCDVLVGQLLAMPSW